VILTKISFLVSPDPGHMAAFDPTLPNTREYVNQGGLSRAAIFNQVEASLRRLKTSYIDLLQIHAFDATTPIEETMRALHELVVAGKVRYIGASGLRVWQLAEMNHIAERNGWTQFVSMQVEHSLLYRTEVSRLIIPVKIPALKAIIRNKRLLHTASTKESA
jgi:aryl-alcohol dehydrogenase-like predicted oxidoreductase